MRKLVLITIGILYLLIALLALAPGYSSWAYESVSYNLFLAVMGLMALGAADLGGDEAKWFDFAFGLLLIVLTFVGAVNFVHYGTGSLANIIINGLAAILLLYPGIILHHRLRH